MSGYCYLIRLQGTNYFKIGVSIDVKSRLEDLDVGPIPVEIVETCLLKSPYKAERIIHIALREFRVRGEWFLVDPAKVRQVFQEHASMYLLDEALDDVVDDTWFPEENSEYVDKGRAIPPCVECGHVFRNRQQRSVAGYRGCPGCGKHPITGEELTLQKKTEESDGGEEV